MSGHSFTFKREKSPDNGFTWEFYNCFSDLLGRDLVDIFNSAYNTGEMLIVQQRGVITLVAMEDSVCDLELRNESKFIQKAVALFSLNFGESIQR